MSKSEKRILVTNDSDFGDSGLVPRGKVFSVVLLKIPQSKPDLLLKVFSKLIKEKASPGGFEGMLVVLNEGGFELFPMLA